MSLNKIIGYILLAAGLVLIGWTLWQSYNIFTDKAPAPLVFKTQQELTSGGVSVLDLQQQINQMVQKQISQVLPAVTITRVLNLSAWTMLALILIWGGGTISVIGIKMIRS